MSPPAPGKRRPAFAAALAAMVVLASLAVSELASRVARRFVCVATSAPFHMAHADYGWTHRPNLVAESHGCRDRAYEFRVAVATNSRGLYDREFAYERSAGVARVLVLGDSVAEAVQVARERNFVKLVERAASATQPVEVINAGVAGFSAINQILFWRSEGARYDPDLVVSVFNLQNDAAEISPSLHKQIYSWHRAIPTADVKVDAGGLLAIDPTAYREFAAAERRRDERNTVRTWLLDNLYLYRRIEHLFSGEAGPQESAAPPAVHPIVSVYVDPASEEWDEAWQLVEAGYRSLAGEVAARGARLAVLIVPAREMVSNPHWELFRASNQRLVPAPLRLDRERPRERILGIVERLGLPHLDLTPELRRRAAETGRSGFYEVDPHPDEEGHARIAAAAAGWLSRELDAAREAAR